MRFSPIIVLCSPEMIYEINENALKDTELVLESISRDIHGFWTDPLDFEIDIILKQTKMKKNTKLIDKLHKLSSDDIDKALFFIRFHEFNKCCVVNRDSSSSNGGESYNDGGYEIIQGEIYNSYYLL